MGCVISSGPDRWAPRCIRGAHCASINVKAFIKGKGEKLKIKPQGFVITEICETVPSITVVTP